MADYRSEYQAAYEKRLAAEKERAEKFPMLDLVSSVFTVSRESLGVFYIQEECDQHYNRILTAKELAALGQELIELSKT